MFNEAANWKAETSPNHQLKIANSRSEYLIVAARAQMADILQRGPRALITINPNKYAGCSSQADHSLQHFKDGEAQLCSFFLAPNRTALRAVTESWSLSQLSLNVEKL